MVVLIHIINRSHNILSDLDCGKGNIFEAQVSAFVGAWLSPGHGAPHSSNPCQQTKGRQGGTVKLHALQIQLPPSRLWTIGKLVVLPFFPSLFLCVGKDARHSSSSLHAVRHEREARSSGHWHCQQNPSFGNSLDTCKQTAVRSSPHAWARDALTL